MSKQAVKPPWTSEWAIESEVVSAAQRTSYSTKFSSMTTFPSASGHVDACALGDNVSGSLVIVKDGRELVVAVPLEVEDELGSDELVLDETEVVDMEPDEIERSDEVGSADDDKDKDGYASILSAANVWLSYVNVP